MDKWMIRPALLVGAFVANVTTLFNAALAGPAFSCSDTVPPQSVQAKEYAVALVVFRDGVNPQNDSIKVRDENFVTAKLAILIKPPRQLKREFYPIILAQQTYVVQCQFPLSAQPFQQEISL